MIGSAKAAVLPVPVWAMPEQVTAGQHDRDGLGLDRRRRDVALALQRLEDRRGEAEVGKHCQLSVLSCGRAHIGCADIPVDAQRRARPFL